MKYDIGDIIRIRDRKEYPEKYRNKVGIILEIEPQLKTYKILICGDTSAMPGLGIWFIEPIIADILYKANTPSP